MKTLIGTSLISLAFLLTACASTDSAEAVGPPMQVLNGDEVTLADFRGQVVLLNFWATWCGPCRVEMPTLQAYYNEYKDQGLTLLSINIGEDAGTAQDYLTDLGLDFPLVLDQDLTLYDHYAIRGQPTTIIIDREGVVVRQHTGLIARSQLDEFVTPLITGG